MLPLRNPVWHRRCNIWGWWVATRWSFGSTGVAPLWRRIWFESISMNSCANLEQVLFGLRPWTRQRQWVRRLSPTWLHLFRRVDQKRRIREENPSFLTSSRGHGCSQRMRKQPLWCWRLKRQRLLGLIPWENLNQKTTSVQSRKKKAVCYGSVLQVFALNVPASSMLTYLVASFVGFLHQHPPLVVQLHGHAAAAVRVFAHPAEELLQLPPQGGVGVGAGLGVAGARHQSL